MTAPQQRRRQKGAALAYCLVLLLPWEREEEGGNSESLVGDSWGICGVGGRVMVGADWRQIETCM